jgi:hypothetical protein
MLRYVNVFLAIVCSALLAMLGILLAPTLIHYVHFRLDVTLGNLISIASIGAGLWKTNDNSKKRTDGLRENMIFRLNKIDEAIQLKLTPVEGKQPRPVSAEHVPFAARQEKSE